MARSPVFIVGSPRSGTSVLVDALFAAGYGGFREGNLLSVIVPLTSVIDVHYATYASEDREVMVSNLDRHALKAGLFRSLAQMAGELNPTGPWLDKTGNPEMIEAIPLIRTVWPDATFVFAKRRGIENIISRLAKFPSRSFDYHCRDWARNMSAWRAVRPGLPERGYLEVDQRDMIAAPEAVAAHLVACLDLDRGQGDSIAETLRLNRPQQSRPGSAESVSSLAASGWSEPDISAFLTHCSVEMDAFGYSRDEEYRRA